ncbi:MAG: DUF4293 family protein [Bacteroidales bacterium]
MIQRIQTLFLAVVLILSLLFLSGNLITFTNKQGTIINAKLLKEANQLQAISSHSKIIINFLVISTIIILFSSVIAISSFKKRKIQLFLTIIIVVLELFNTVAIVLLIYELRVGEANNFIPGIRLIIPPINILMALLAAKGIRHDENLIKSYERLR